jgi:hypothetical protein
MDAARIGPLVVEGALAAAAGPAPAGAGLVVPRERAGPRRLGPPVWRPLDPERALAVLLAAPADALLMARPPAADPGAACLPALGRLIELDVVVLPAAAADAAWAVALAWRWREQGQAGLPRLLDVLVGLAGASGGLPLRPWGAAATPVPALRPAALARWASRCWRPCAWCRRGGGLPGRSCGRCGSAIPATAPVARPARRRELALAGAGRP